IITTTSPYTTLFRYYNNDSSSNSLKIGGRKMTNTDIALEKRGTATEIQKSGVILDVVNAEQAKIAEQAGAVAVMALERVPSDIRDRKSTRLNSSHAS